MSVLTRGEGRQAAFTMQSLCVFAFVALSFILNDGVIGRRSDQCKDQPVSFNPSSCPSGCKLGYGTKKPDADKTQFCTSNIGVKCKGKKSNITKETRFGPLPTCNECRTGLDGEFCSRRNLVYKNPQDGVFKDANDKTCDNLNGTIHLALNNSSSDITSVDIFFETHEGENTDLKNCTVKAKGKTCSFGDQGSKRTQHGVFYRRCTFDSVVKSAKKIIVKWDASHSRKAPRLCEVKAYTCRNFWYGVDCSELCNCWNGLKCDKLTGECPVSGCAAGYYGKNCTFRCPTCIKGEVCNGKNGSCPSGVLVNSTKASGIPGTTTPSTSVFTPAVSQHDADLSSVPVSLYHSLAPAVHGSTGLGSKGLGSVTFHSQPSDTPSSQVVPDTATVQPNMTDPVTDTSGADSTMMHSITVSSDVSSISTVQVDLVTADRTVADSTTDNYTPETNVPKLVTDISTSESGVPELSTKEPDNHTSTSDVPQLSTTEAHVVSSSSIQPDVSVITTPDVSVKVPHRTSPFSPAVTARPTAPASTEITELSTTAKGGVSSPSTVSTTEQGHTDSSQGKVIAASTTAQKPSAATSGGDNGESWGNMAPVIGVLAVLLVIGAVVGGIFYYRIRHKPRDKLVADEDVTDPENNAAGLRLELRKQNGANQPASAGLGDQSMYANVSETFTLTTEPVNVDIFRVHLDHMEKEGGYIKEFQALPQGFQKPVTAANAVNQGEVKKNRFKDISPYDKTRVVLVKEKELDSDYINASYIDVSALRPVDYKEPSQDDIAAQGPLPDTVGDFWHMVWMEGCGKIVMVTNLCESGKVKCEQYWPQQEGSSQHFGNYTVTSIKVTQKAHFVHRLLGVSRNAGQRKASEVCRQIDQFHFTAWPDHGVPCPVALVQFWSYVTPHPSQLAGPLLVHCSAGIGRTGTYIALDMLTHQAESTQKVSIFPTVRRLRNQRVNMVQTSSQYQFLHEVVGEWLASQDGQLVKDDLLHGSQWREEGQSKGDLPAVVKQKFLDQFKALDEMRPKVTNDQLTSALLEENVGKNRSSQIFPVEQFCVGLCTADGENGDYINAVIVPSLTQRHGYIMTQLPLQDTVGDFWRMVRDWRVKVVVRFLDTPQDQVTLYPKVGGQTRHGSVTIHTLKKSVPAPGVTAYAVQLHSQNSGTQQGEDRSVDVYCVQSQGALSLKNTAAFVSLVNILLPLVTTAGQPPVVIQCFDGAGLSCVLCGLMMAAESLEAEGRACPFLSVRLIHAARPQAFSTAEQYEFVIRCLLHRVQGIFDHDTEDTTEMNCDSETAQSEDPVYGNV